MRRNDKWSRQWVINDATDEHLAAVLLEDKGITRFRLRPIRDRGKVVCYRVDFRAGEMRSCWKGPVYLLPRGSKPVVKPKPGPGVPSTPLDRWVPASPSGPPPHRGEYETMAKLIREACDNDPDAERLEGDIHVKGRAEKVTLFQVSGGVLPDKRTFLVIDVRAHNRNVTLGKTTTGKPKFLESGIAHGNM